MWVAIVVKCWGSPVMIVTGIITGLEKEHEAEILIWASMMKVYAIGY